MKTIHLVNWNKVNTKSYSNHEFRMEIIKKFAHFNDTKLGTWDIVVDGENMIWRNE